MAERTYETHTREKGNILKANAPRPNIVRIEVLDFDTQNEYLGLGDAIAGTTKQTFQASREPNRALGEGIFYGFLKSGGDLSIAYGAEWKPNANGSGLLGAFQAVANTIVPPDGKIQTIVGASRNLLHDLTGVSMTTTGGSSLKSFTAMTMQGFVIECGWYMPEQEIECIGQLRQLMLMSYPAAATKDKVTAGVTDVINSIITATTDVVADPSGIAGLGSVPGFANIKSPLTPDPKSDLAGLGTKGTMATVISFGVNAVGTIGEIFGAAYTYDPRPVRLCIGHYADILPLVIANVSISMSKEQFVGGGGRHLPLFCTVKINFDWWLTPHPHREFMGIFGNEFFGTESTIQNDEQLADAIAKEARAANVAAARGVADQDYKSGKALGGTLDGIVPAAPVPTFETESNPGPLQ
jgi:hypothetical protein